MSSLKRRGITLLGIYVWYYWYFIYRKGLTNMFKIESVTIQRRVRLFTQTLYAQILYRSRCRAHYESRINNMSRSLNLNYFLKWTHEKSLNRITLSAQSNLLTYHSNFRPFKQIVGLHHDLCRIFA